VILCIPPYVFEGIRVGNALRVSKLGMKTSHALLEGSVF
jgi:hypothetical protein